MCTHAQKKQKPERDSSFVYVSPDTLLTEFEDTFTVAPEKKIKIYDPRKAALLSAGFPGLGQIYNKKYWKLPFIYGGFAGLTYGIVWNNKWYNNYSNYYVDITDGDPTTTRYLDLVSQEFIDGYSGGESELATKFKQKKESYRRDRDFVIILTVGLYVLNILDASVDAHLSDFDIGKDLSLKVQPEVQYNDIAGSSTMGMSCRLRF